MTVTVENPETPYVPTGSTLGPFATVWSYADPADVSVVIETDGVEAAPLALGVGYALTPTVREDGGFTGQVTLTGLGRPAGGWQVGVSHRLILRRATVSAQGEAFGRVDGFRPQVAEGAWDKLMRLVQEQRAALARAVLGPVGALNLRLPPLAALEGMLIGVAGGLLVAVNPSITGGAADYALSNVNEVVGRAALGVEPYLHVRSAGATVENSAAIQAQMEVAPGTLQLSDGTHLVRAGVLAISPNVRHLRGVGQHVTRVLLADALTTNKQLIKCNNRSKVVISDLTLDGGASQAYMEGVLFPGTATIPVDAGVQLRIAMRGDVGSSLAITGAGISTPPLAWTHATSMFAGEVKSVLVTPTTTGTMTLTSTGTVRQVAVVRNGGGLSSLLNMFNSADVELRNVSLVNFDTLGVVSNGGSNIRLTGTSVIDRGADSWEQNVGFLWTWTPGTTARHGHVFIAGTVKVLRTGVQGEGDNVFIADGATIGGTGYGSCVATLVGSGRCHIGNLNYLPNAAYLDQDVTSISYGEHYGWGVLICPTGSGNPGAPLYICGAMEVISPNIRDSNSYYHALGQDNVPAINFGWLSSTVNSSGAVIRGGGAGDTRSGAARTMGYAIGDTNGNVYGTTVLDFVAYNTITGRYIFNTTPGNNRRFRGLRTTGTVTYDPPSLAPGASGTTQTLTVSGAKVGDRVVGRSFSLSSQGIQIWAEVTAANTLSFYFYSPAGNPFGTVNLLSGVCTFEIEESATA